MNTKVILKVDTLKNLVEWVGRNFVLGEHPTNARVLSIYANKPGTSMEDDAVYEYSKFNGDKDAEQYFNAFANMKFIIESELADQDIIRDDTTAKVIDIKETWRITVTPSVNNTEDAFNMYCAWPYNPDHIE